MKCIFCHKDSTTSKSVEHIIPESLGNKQHVLPKGYVCDECNHYFAVKIEKELLEQPYFISMRSRNEIKTKKDRLVKQKMIFNGNRSEVRLDTSNNVLNITLLDDEVFDLIEKGDCHEIYANYVTEPNYPDIIMSRFLAKCAYEFFLYNVGEGHFDDCVRECMTKGSTYEGLNPLREYTRYGKGKLWEYNQRRIYPEGSLFRKEGENIREILFEMSFLVTKKEILDNNDVAAEIYYLNSATV